MTERKARVTSIDVARLAGVSQSAVSRAFTPGTSISVQTRRKVLAAAQALNYVPNSIARSLITRRSNMVAMVVGDLQNPFYCQVLDAVSQALQQRGVQVLVFRVALGSEVDAALMSVLEYQIDGMVITSAQVSAKMAELCAERDIPVVMVNRYVPGLRVHSVCCNNARGARLAAGALIEAGGSRFAAIIGTPDAALVQGRMLGFTSRVTAAGFDPAGIRTDCGHFSYQGGHDAALRLFADAPPATRPDALFCLNDIMAIGAMDALRHRLGLRVPEDVQVVGFDDIPEAARPGYRLTTIRQPLRRMVAKTMTLLRLDPDSAAASATDSTALFIEGDLIQRDTVGQRRSPVLRGGAAGESVWHI
ncbi:MAG: LacI family DNA-binding transcriptional regulator [Alphaproteobacteria bacterium]